MRGFRYAWLVGLGLTLLIIALPIIIFAQPERARARSPWDFIQRRPAHVDHSKLIEGEFKTGQEVTAKCMSCHAEAAQEVMQTTHFTWQNKPVYDPVRGEEVSIGKKNVLNNFCIGIQSNWPACTKCHVGYGWQDAAYDFTNPSNVDCLVCHDQSGVYLKGAAGNPKEDVNLLMAARSVGSPTRLNCGGCHFNGGGGAGVKHGDLDPSLYFPSQNVDIHMGRVGLECIDCHKTRNHLVSGRLMSVSVDTANQIDCTNCHEKHTTHRDSRINTHLNTVACQTCHIPEVAKREPTKTEWDWSAAGQDLQEDPHTYLKIKGNFVYEKGIRPVYAWYNGTADHYLLGDKINPATVTFITKPRGDIRDPNALIFPFKVHVGKQPYDATYNYLLQPATLAEGGYKDTFDWDKSLRMGEQATGIPYSGKYGFAPTQMYWPLTHMVAPTTQALGCTDCHGAGATRMDWAALGYPGDPLLWGGRK